MRPIQLFRPTFAIDECLAEIRECLEKGWTGLGYKTVEFENAWSDYTDLAHSHFVNSATSGLHLAVNIFKEVDGWHDGDEVISSPLTFVSTNEAILYERLRPIFADVDQYLCLDPDDLERKLGPRTRAVIFVGHGGSSGQFDRIADFCRRKGLRLILDAAHMAGTRVNGATPKADAVVYSFQAVKTLPTADSGMVCFAEKEMDALARKKSWLGIDKDTYSRMSSNATYRWMYEVDTIGFKYHGNSIMAALGLVQLRYLDRDVAYRRQIAAWYDAQFRGIEGIRLTPPAPGCASAQHLYQVQVEDRDELILDLNSQEIYPGVHYRDNRDYAIFRTEKDDCPAVTRASRCLVSLPIHLGLSEADIAFVAEQTKAFIARKADER